MEISPFYVFLLAAVVLFALELGVFQLSVFWFLFAAIGASVTAAVCWFLPATGWTAAIGIFAAATVATVVLLYPLLRRLQSRPGGMAGNDAVGQRVSVIEPIAPSRPGKVSWSGGDWSAELAAGETRTLEVGEQASIAAIEGIRLIVRPL